MTFWISNFDTYWKRNHKISVFLIFRFFKLLPKRNITLDHPAQNFSSNSSLINEMLVGNGKLLQIQDDVQNIKISEDGCVCNLYFLNSGHHDCWPYFLLPVPSPPFGCPIFAFILWWCWWLWYGWWYRLVIGSYLQYLTGWVFPVRHLL